MNFEISVDDNSPDNYRSLDLLKKLGLKATFFLQYFGLDQKFMRDALSAGMEIGGHSVTHPEYLRKLEPPEQWKEIQQSKILLEKLGATVTKFAYPSGRYDDLTVELVKRAGFSEARTVEILKTDTNFDPFRKPATIHVLDARKEYQGKGWDWHAREALLYISESDRGDEYFHIWWHSWEVDKFGQWEKLEELLKHAQNINENLPS